MSDGTPQTLTPEILASLAGPLAQSLGLRLWGVELAFGGRGLIRIFVEKDDSSAVMENDGSPVAGEEDVHSQAGVSVEECAELSRLLGLTLDVEDIIPGAYVLEVSSPGLERTFFTAEQLARAVGQVVAITLRAPSELVPGRRKFKGLLVEAGPSGADEDIRFTLQAEGVARPGEAEPVIFFDFSQLAKARQVHAVPEKVLPGKGRGKGASQKSGGKDGVLPS